MAGGVAMVDVGAALRFREIRAFLRRSRAVSLAVFFGVVYALGSLVWGGMLSLFPLHGGTTVEILTGGGTGQGWWNYPGLLVVAPWGVLALPFFATFAMIVVAAGVGLGMAVAAVLIARLVRPSPEEAARSKAIGVATGLTPAMLSLVTIGSCCTTTAAATGGVGLIAQASGTTTSNLLLNNWYLGVAQIAIVWAALFGQELLLTVYGGLLGLRGTERSRSRSVVPPLDRRWVLGATLRALLVVGGVLWSLSMFAEWTTHAPGSAGAGWWVRWTVQHQLVAGLAVGAAFFPVGASRVMRSVRRGYGRIFGGVIAIAALSVLVWLPPPLPSWGLDSLANQLLGLAGAPTAWGAIPLGQVTGWPLYVRWGLEYLLPAGFVLGAVLAPDTVLAPLLATLVRVAPTEPLGPTPFLPARAGVDEPGPDRRPGPAPARNGGAATPEVP